MSAAAHAARRQGWAVGWILAALLLTSGCNRTEPSEPASSDTTSTSSSPTTPTTVVHREAIVFAQCSPGTAGEPQPWIELVWLSPAGLEISRRRFEIRRPVDNDRFYCEDWGVREPNLAPLLRARFDGPFERLAALIHSNDRLQVGWVKFDPAGAYEQAEALPTSFRDPEPRSLPFFDHQKPNSLLYVAGALKLSTKHAAEGEIVHGESVPVKRYSIETQTTENVGSAALASYKDQAGFTIRWPEGEPAPFDFRSRAASLPTLPESRRRTWSPVRSPDGQHVAFLSSSGTPEVFTVPTAGGEPQFVWRAPNSTARYSYLLSWE